MRKGLIFVLSILFLVTLCNESNALDSKGKWSLGLNVGYYFPQFSNSYEYNDINLDNPEISMDAADDFSIGVNFNYRMTDRIFFQLMLEKYEGDLEFDFSAYDPAQKKFLNFDSEENTRISIMPLSFDLGYSVLMSKIGDMDYDLYLLFGSSFLYSTNHIYRPSEFYNYNVKYPENNDGTIGFNGGAGIDFFFTKRFAANFDLRYYWGQADFNTDTDFDLGGFRGSIGLKIVLGSIE
jgi:opacity protein-like surface antigen